MSNTSYPFKENSNVMNVQGGEKKVMKKILTVALSTAMAFSMFASVAFGDTAVTPQQKFDALAAKGIFNGYPDGSAHLEKEMTRAEFAKVITKLLGLKEVTGTLSYKDKGYDAKNWAVPYIEAVTAAGIMQGQDSVKKIFNFNGKVTIQEMATVLTRALKLEVPANPDNNAADWAKGYVQAAIDKGLISKDANFKANASRSQLVEAAYAIDQANSITFTYKVVDPSNVEFTLSTGEVVKVKLDTPLEANKETEVKFKDAAGNEYTAKVTYVVTTATKVDSVSATNLKEVAVKFDGTVNKNSAETLASYTIEDDSDALQNIKSAQLQSDNKTVVLTLTTNLENQEDYKLTVKNVKGTDTTKTVSATDVAFKPVDSELPTVTSVEGLGNKAIKITFSEPVQSASTVAGTFKLDDSVVSGVISGSGTRTLIVELFSPLSTAEHNLTINNNIKDYAGYNLITTTQKFTVVEDKTAPTIAEVRDVTLEGATVVFSEDVKELQAKTASNYYWMNGTTKHTAASVEPVDGRTYKLTFTDSHKLPAVATDLFVTNVVDYSGNVVADNTKVTVNPVIDQTRPEVVSEIFNDSNELKLTFNKAIDLSTFKTSNVVLKDADGKVVTGVGYTVVEGSVGSSKTLTLKFSKDLGAGTYTIEVSGLRDTTTLQNTLLPYTTTLVAKDQAAPKVVNVNGSGNVYYVTFDRAMDISSSASVLEPENYYLTYTQNGNTRTGKLPSGTNIVPVNGNKGVIITLPTSVTNVSEITIQGVKSASGVYLSGYAQKFGTGDINKAFQAASAYATAKDTVYLKLNQPVSDVVNFTSVTVNGSQVTNAVVDSTDSTLIKLTLGTKLDSTEVPNTVKVVVPAGKLKNLAGADNATIDQTVLDAIAPQVVKNAAGNLTIGNNGSVEFTSNSATIKFQEDVKVKNTAKLVDNIKVVKENGLPLEYGTDFTVSTASADLTNGTDSIALDLSNANYEGKLYVVFENSNGNVVDASANNADTTENTSLAAEGFDTHEATGAITIDASAPTLSGFALKANDANAEVIEVTVSETLNLNDGAAVTGFTVTTNNAAVAPASVKYDKANNKIVITAANDGDFDTTSKVAYTAGNVADVAGNQAAAVAATAVK